MFELEDYNADVLPDEKQKNKWQLSADLPVAVTNIVPH